jgi:hypothetical protein
MADITAHGVAPVHIVREAAPASLSNEFHVLQLSQIVVLSSARRG